MRLKKFGALFVLCLAVPAAAVSAASAETTVAHSDPSSPSVTSTADPSSFGGWKVEHFGYSSGGKSWSSGVLDASVASNRVASRFAPQALAIGGATPSLVGFTCTLAVSKVTYSAVALHATSLETCTGAFKNQYTGAKFEHDNWNGWHDYSSASSSPTSNANSATYVWSVGCNIGNDRGGSYNYRLYALPWAQSSEDGTWHGGTPVWSALGTKFTCGSGLT